MKKNCLLIFFILVIIFLPGCNSQKENVSSQVPEPSPQTSGSSCQEESVVLPNYGDPGKRLKNCFIEYPGEPSREDKSYYIVEDICGQFTDQFIQKLLGKTIVKTEPSAINGLYNCSYFVNQTEYLMLVLEYLSADGQKKGHEILGRSVKVEPSIVMQNYSVWQEDGVLNTLYLILNPDKFLSIKRSAGLEMTSEEIVSFASRLAVEIKEYK